LLPPTIDHKLALHLLRDLDALQLPTLGNNLAEALQYSITALQDATGKKSIFLLSDGDIEPAAIREAATLIEAVLIKEGISLFIAGTGGVEKVALPAALVPPALADNRTILTRREEGRLLQLAEAANGQYYPMEKIVERDLPELLQLPVIIISAGESERVLWNEWFGIPLLVGLLLLFAGLHFSCRINNRLATSLLFLVMPVLIADHPAMAAVSAEEVLASGDYRQAKTLFMQQEGYSARFGEGTACYRLKDFLCARQAFSRAAWEAGNSKDRGRAAFNLGNTHFQLGEFEEAAVLFAEAERNGVPARIARRNHEFAIELAISVRKYLTHIELTKRKADWMANARDIPEGLLNRLTEGITFENDKSRMALLKTLSREQLDQLLRRGVARALGKSVAGSGRERAWAATESLPPESIIGLFNRLLPLEAGLNVVPETPYAIEGQRPW
jgi:tetratricopeptide (TPR) repeat protein